MRVALYPRVSGHEQEDNYSIPEQIERMKKYCDAKDWMVYKIYTDSVQSGADMDRPGLQSMIKDCEAGKIDMVLVYKLDRLSRSQKDTMYLIEDVFEKNNVGFTSMTENFDTSPICIIKNTINNDIRVAQLECKFHLYSVRAIPLLITILVSNRSHKVYVRIKLLN